MKRALVQIWGGHGDAIWASSVLRCLKAEGYHVTVLASRFAEAVLRHDPHVDEILVRSSPASDLSGGSGNYYDRVIDVTRRSTYRHMLPRPGDPLCAAPIEERRRLLAELNYVEHIHRLVGYPDGPYEPRFYPTPEERARALARKPTSGKTVVLAVAGGAEYKRWPWIGGLVRLVLERTCASVFLVGSRQDEAHLQEAFDMDPAGILSDRVVNLCGQQVRDAYALAQVADAVVGPETGVLNAVATEPNRKVVLLSHSTAYNLCRDWLNTVTLAPNVPCHPCHRLHDRGTRDCPRDPSGAWAACAASIRAARVFEALSDVLKP